MTSHVSSFLNKMINRNCFTVRLLSALKVKRVSYLFRGKDVTRLGLGSTLFLSQSRVIRLSSELSKFERRLCVTAVQAVT